MNLRIYADFNSGGSPGQGWCRLLRYGGQPLDAVADELHLRPGMVVTLYYEEERDDQGEAFEVEAVLEQSDDPAVRWRAWPDWTTFRTTRA